MRKAPPKKKAESREASAESAADWPRQQARALTKPMGKGGFDAPSGPGAAGPSHAGWQSLLTPQVGHKRAAASSQSPKKTPTKVARQLAIQYRISQEDLQPPPVWVYLPLAPMGAPRAFKTSRKSVALGTAEWDNLDRQVRANEELYTRQGQMPGTVRMVLQQLAQPSGRTDEPMVPRLKDDELCLRNAGVRLQDQARVQNIHFFSEREQERQLQQQSAPTIIVAVEQITSSIAGQQQLPPADSGLKPITPPPPPLPAADSVDDNMDGGQQGTEQNQDGVSMGDGNGAQEKDDLGAVKTKKA